MAELEAAVNYKALWSGLELTEDTSYHLQNDLHYKNSCLFTDDDGKTWDLALAWRAQFGSSTSEWVSAK